jgi:hypothetical protein
VPVRVPEPVCVIDPPPPLEPLPDLRAAVQAALARPLGAAPLRAAAGPGSRVTVAFDDPCVLLPPPLADPRRVVLEEVVATLLEAGVRADDLTLVCANGLHQTWTKAELLPILGPALIARFGHRLRCYDAEDPDQNVELPRTPSGLAVEVSRLVADADLVVYAGIPWTEMNGGHKSLACGLATYRCIDQHHRPSVQAQSPLMHPERSLMHDRLTEIGRVIGEHVPVFQVETVVNNRLWAGPLRLLDLRRRRVAPGLGPARSLPAAVRRTARRALFSSYQAAGVWAGAVEPVHRAAVRRLAAARGLLSEQGDILVLGVPNMSPYSVHSDMNPILVANSGLGYSFQLGRPRPLVRPGGTVILANPCDLRFHPRHDAAYRRFWEEVLPATRDPLRMEQEFQPAFVEDAALVEAYRHRRAYHPAHPFYMWYWTVRAREHVGRVILAGCREGAVAERLGAEAAPTVEAAVELARDRLGRDAAVVVQTTPPVFTVDVGRTVEAGT